MAQLTPNEKKVFLALIDQATERMGNNGCNDFDLETYMMEHERRALAKEMNAQNGEPEAYDEKRSYRDMPDFWLLEHLAKKAIE